MIEKFQSKFHFFANNNFKSDLGGSMRKFEIVNNRKSNGAIKMPNRATKASAGYDFYSPIDAIIEPNTAKLIFTDIKACFGENEVLILCSTSGMGKRGIVLANGIGIIDADYYNNASNEGNIGFMLRNLSNEPYEIKCGDKIGQGIFTTFLKIDNEGEINAERVGGFGSTVEK